MTAQFGENFRYDGREMSMTTHPLGDYFALGGVNPGLEGNRGQTTVFLAR